MNLVDSSGWLAYFAGEKNSGFFAQAIEDTESLIVPSICLCEVFKVLLRERNEEDALIAITSMQQGRGVDLDGLLALDAASIGNEEGLALADAIIYATARVYDATLWTQDAHFSGKPGVRFRRKAGNKT